MYPCDQGQGLRKRCAHQYIFTHTHECCHMICGQSMTAAQASSQLCDGCSDIYGADGIIATGLVCCLASCRVDFLAFSVLMQALHSISLTCSFNNPSPLLSAVAQFEVCLPSQPAHLEPITPILGLQMLTEAICCYLQRYTVHMTTSLQQHVAHMAKSQQQRMHPRVPSPQLGCLAQPCAKLFTVS